MSATPSLAFVIQRAIRKAIRASATSLRQHLNCVRITEDALEVSDEWLELTCHTGELALRRCYLDRVARSPLAKRPCGYLKMMEAEILSASLLALLVTTSDLKAGHMPDCVAVEMLHFLFGIMSHRLTDHQAQCRFNSIFEDIVCAADSAYLSYATHTQNTVSHDSPNRRQQVAPKPGRFAKVRKYLKVVRELEEECAEPSLSRVRQTVSSICASVSQEVDKFMDPLPWTPAHAFSLPRHITLKPYLGANAPSPPSRNHRLVPRRRSQPLSQEEYASSYYAVCPEPRLPQCTSIQCYRLSAPAPGTNYTPPSPPPTFAPFGQNHSPVLTLAP
ncbi:hypothetical protein K438DRAFT_1962698 [Mycena galopus ATCC 62051]|nr:hypothetical protein K438DRAFT_1962698 [Mycena galopus ATCC 62051]